MGTFQIQPDPFATQQSGPSNTAKGERLGELLPVTIPEQVVGSRHRFEIDALHNLSPLAAIGAVTIAGSADLKLESNMPISVATMASHPLGLLYSPTSAGDQRATVTLVMRWEDGHVETRTIQVLARARKIDDVPGGSAPVAQQAVPTPPAPPAPDRVLMVDANLGWQTANTAFLGMMGEQREGVNLVAKEAEKFKPKPAERSLWQDLADIAFQLGTGAIAGLVARFVASRVSAAIVGAEHAAKAADAGETEIAEAENGATAAKGDAVEERIADRRVVAAKVGNFSRADAAKQTKFAQGELGSAVGMAVSTSITKTANEIRGPGNGSAHGSEEKQASAVSLDGELAFFSEQKSMVGALETSGQDRLNALLAEQIKQYPAISGQLMKGVKEGFDDARGAAKERQATTTSAQFMTYLARTNLGTEKIGARTVTDMKEQRGHDASLLEPANLATGVLEIVCDYQRGQIRVIDARSLNVSWLVVNRLLDKKLDGSGIPIRLSLHGGGTIITRDEAGRVRISGMLDLTQSSREEQQVGEAERVFSIVLGKSLADWGVAQIHTNDATQGPDPKKENGKV